MDTPPLILTDDLPDDVRALVKPELAPDERLIWASKAVPRVKGARGGTYPGATYVTQPVAQPWYVAAIAFICLIAGIVCLAAGFGSFGVLFERKNEGLPFMFGVLGVFGGCIAGLSAINQWANRRKRLDHTARSLYALTDRRAICWVPHRDSEAVEVHSVRRGKLKGVHRVEYPDGTGDVRFEYREDTWGPVTGMEGIPEVRRVEDLVRRTLVEVDSEPSSA